MNHIPLDAQDDAIKQFVLSLPADPQGSLLELGGRAIVCVLPAAAVAAEDDGPWTPEKNARRCDLIDRKYAGTISPVELPQLAALQAQMLRYRQRVAPLPLDDARRLHEELLAKAAANPGS